MMPSVPTGTQFDCNTAQSVTSPSRKKTKRNTKIHVSKSNVKRSKRGTLIDRGANGGILGNDAVVIFKRGRRVDVTGIDNHEMNSLPMVDATAKAESDKGPVIVIMRNYAYHGVNRTLHSAGQIEWFGNEVNDKSFKVGGRQCIITTDKYYFPLNIIRGLPCFNMVPNTAKEFEELPHVVLTQGRVWDPRVLDFMLTDQPNWIDEVKKSNDPEYISPFTLTGEFKNRELPAPSNVIEDPKKPDPELPTQSDIDIDFHEILHDSPPDLIEAFQHVYNLNMIYVYTNDVLPDDDKDDDELIDPTEDDDDVKLEVVPTVDAKSKPLDYEKMRPFLLFVSKDKVKWTFDSTTQNAARVVSGGILRQTMRSPNPFFNIRRRHEAVATDSIYADVPAVDTPGHVGAQMFIGRSSLVADCYGFASTKEYVNTLLDCIRDRGAMDKIISDHADYQKTPRVLDILRTLLITHWKSEAYYQQQNFAERRWGQIKRTLEFYMDWRDVQPNMWLLCLRWVCDVFNILSERSLGKRPPLEILTGQTQDISYAILFLFNDVVYVARHADDLPGSERSEEIRGRFAGFAFDVGHALTFKVLTDDTQKIIKRSILRLADDPDNKVRLDMNNQKLDKEAGVNPALNFRTAGRDPCLHQDFVMHTLPTDREPYPNQDDDSVEEPSTDDQSVDTVIDEVPELHRRGKKVHEEDLDEIPELPERWDEDLDTRGRKETQEFLHANKEKRSKRHSMQGRRTPSPNRNVRRSKRLRGETAEDFQVNVMSILDPVKAKKDRAIQEKIRARSPTRAHKTDVESKPAVEEPITDTEGMKTYKSPMENPPLKDEKEKAWTTEDEADQPDYLQEQRKPGTPNPLKEPISFKGFLKTHNPTESGLKPEEMINRTFLMPPLEDGTRYRAKIMEQVREHRDNGHTDPEYIKFRCKVNNDYDEIVAYNDIVDFIEKDRSWEGIWTFEKILDHKNVKPGDQLYKGSRVSCLVLWSTGEKTWEPLYTAHGKGGLWIDDPATVAIYAREKKLLDEPGWKLPGLKKAAKTQKRVIRLANKAKLHSFRHKPIYMYGFQVPRNYQEALELDARNGNTLWQDATALELAQIDEYDTFVDKGVGVTMSKDWTRIGVHLVYAVKHDGRHKARLVAGGHLTETPVDSVYSSVVSLRGIRMLTFLGELNELEVWSTDIGNAYLETYTQEKVYIIAGPEFGDREGHTLVISKALYGLKSSGLRWSERLADVLRSMGFVPSKAEKDIWMRDKGTHYEYVAVYVDDLLIASKDPKAIIDALTDDHKFKLKGTGPTTFHLGCDFFRDEDGVLCYAPRKYIEKILENYRRIYGTYPKEYTSPLAKGDHPELDTTELLGLDDQKIYQSLIGALQWVIQIGRFDITTAVMTLSRFRAAPRQGHLDRVKRVHGYLSKMRHGIVKVRTDVPDYSEFPRKEYDWEYSCYKGAKEEIPKDAPIPKGKSVKTTSFYDANLYHDLISGKSVTGVLHLLNRTPIDWYSKLQSTVETATFGSEYVAARTCVEQILDLRLTLRYLGVPIDGASMVFGDNESVVNTASIPHSRLHKRWVALSYHRVRECIAAGVIQMYHIPGKTNPSDILTKHWDLASVWEVLKPLLFWNWRGSKHPPRESEEDIADSKMRAAGEEASKVDANKPTEDSTKTLSEKG